MSDGPLSLPLPPHFVSFPPAEGKKAKRPTLIPSSANDDTDTSAGSAGREDEEKGRVPNSTLSATAANQIRLVSLLGESMLPDLLETLQTMRG